jgi:hypothetical protein
MKNEEEKELDEKRPIECSRRCDSIARSNPLNILNPPAPTSARERRVKTIREKAKGKRKNKIKKREHRRRRS